MGRQARKLRREEILLEMRRLSEARVNDAVRLAYLGQDEADRIGELDLTALREFKRNGSGGVEIKLNDRLLVLERLLTLMDEGGEGRAGADFLQALERRGDEDG